MLFDVYPAGLSLTVFPIIRPLVVVSLFFIVCECFAAFDSSINNALAARHVFLSSRYRGDRWVTSRGILDRIKEK